MSLLNQSSFCSWLLLTQQVSNNSHKLDFCQEHSDLESLKNKNHNNFPCYFMLVFGRSLLRLCQEKEMLPLFSQGLKTILHT